MVTVRPRRCFVLSILAHDQFRVKGFRHKTGSLRSDRTVKKLVDFHYAQAPMQIDDCDHSISNKLGGTFGYWQPRGSDPNTECLAAVTWADDLCKQEGPFDGVFAFSQGAALAALLISLQTTQPQAAPHIRFRFACFFSGFIPTVIGGGVRVDSSSKESVTSKGLELPWLPNLNSASEDLHELPSLHCYGTSDDIISSQHSMQLATLFSDKSKTVIEHPGGHMVPAGSVYKKQFKAFILQQTN